MAVPPKTKTSLKVSIDAKERWKKLVAPDSIDDTEAELFEKTIKILEKLKAKEATSDGQ